MGEAFDVSYDNIQKRFDTGVLQKKPIEYGFIKKDNRGETVTLTFAIRTGKLEDLMDKGLTASYTARMLNKGTTSKSRQDIEDKLSALKSSIFFSGANGRLTANLTTTKENLMETLGLMTDMIKNPVFDAEELEKMKTQALASIEENKTDPQFLASRKLSLLSQQYKKGHPLYNMTIDEEVEAIKNVSVAALKDYHKNFYGISNSATLTAIGNIEEQELKDYFDKEYGDFGSSLEFTPIKNEFSENVASNEKILTPDKKNAFTLGRLSFECSQYDDDYAALQIAGEIFGGGFLNSRIATRLRQQDGVSYGAGGAVRVDEDKSNRNSMAFIYAIYAPENEAKVQTGFKEEIARFIDGGITEEELKSAVNGWVQEQNVSRAKDNELLRLLNNNMYYDRDMIFQKNIEDKVTALTVADVNAAIKKYFKTFDKWTVVNAGDFENFEIKNSDKKVD